MRKKKIIIIILAFLLFISAAGEVSAATTVFLTSDNVLNKDDNIKMLESIKDYIEELSNGEIEVIIDSEAPQPGEGTRAALSDSDVSVSLAAACAGNFLELANYATDSDKKFIYVNTGGLDLDNLNSLRRAWDDNYSQTSFAGINSPGKFLDRAGISYIQASDDGNRLSEYSEDVNREIAQGIVREINSNSTGEKYVDESLIITHELSPATMAKASKALVESANTQMNESYNSYTAPQLLYLTGSYLNGNALKSPESYNPPTDPQEYSENVKDSYSVYDYMTMGGIVKGYMDENGRAPNYIEYDGAKISYYDLLYNFAKITENHTDKENMNFSSEYEFEKVNESIIPTIIPVIIGLIILAIAYAGVRKIRRK